MCQLKIFHCAELNAGLPCRTRFMLCDLQMCAHKSTRGRPSSQRPQGHRSTARISGPLLGILLLAMAATVVYAQYLVGGDYNTCAVTETGGLRCWGHNRDYELGIGSKLDQNRPLATDILNNVTQVDAGTRSTCAICNGEQPACALVALATDALRLRILCARAPESAAAS